MSETIKKAFRHATYGDLYKFRFEKSGISWSVFVESHPHNPIGGSAHDTHILDGNRLCLAEAPQSLDRAVALSHTWLHYFSKYIRTGATHQSSVRVHINDKKR